MGRPSITGLMVALLGACGGRSYDVDGSTDGASGAGLAALPPAASVDGDHFATGDRCAACHGAPGGVIVDQAGRDVSPVTVYATSMMAWSARDPYWLAVWSGERADHPTATGVVDDLCTRCHAPMGARELAARGGAISLDTILTSTAAAGHLARDGVGCTSCHQIQPTGLGQPGTYDGQFVTGVDRLIYGPHTQPFPMPMMRMVNFTPTEGAHVATSELCASCHTVVTRALDDAGQLTGPEVNEQMTYLEWRASSFPAAGVTCQTCHAPTTDVDGEPIAARLSPMPPWLNPRAPIGRHVFAGVNAYMLAILADNQAWTGSTTTAAQLAAGVDVATAMGRAAVMVAVDAAEVVDGRLQATIRVTNRTGHKLPTGYPGRRMWLHLRAIDGAGAVVFESGAVDGRGHLVGAGGAVLDPVGTLLPHRDQLTAADQVALWEAVQVDRAGAPTHALLAAWAMGKDDRLLPAGWTAAAPDALRTVAIGVDGDGDFGPGQDTVHLDVVAPGAVRLEVEVQFQSVPPAAIEAVVARPSPAATTFAHMTARRAPTPVTLATVTRALP